MSDEILTELSQALVAALCQRGINEASAYETAGTAIKAIRARLGGTTAYIPKGRGDELSLRNDRIRADYDRYKNVNTVAIRHGVTANTVYRVVRRR